MTGILLLALVWINGADVPLEGAPFGAFMRLPADIQDRTNPEIRSMAGHTSGLKVPGTLVKVNGKSSVA